MQKFFLLKIFLFRCQNLNIHPRRSFDLNDLKNGSAQYFENSLKSLHFFQGLIRSIDLWLGFEIDPKVSSRHLCDLDKLALGFQPLHSVQNNWLCIFLNFSYNTNFLGNMEAPRTKSMYKKLGTNVHKNTKISRKFL